MRLICFSIPILFASSSCSTLAVDFMGTYRLVGAPPEVAFAVSEQAGAYLLEVAGLREDFGDGVTMLAMQGNRLTFELRTCRSGSEPDCEAYLWKCRKNGFPSCGHLFETLNCEILFVGEGMADLVCSDTEGKRAWEGLRATRCSMLGDLRAGGLECKNGLPMNGH